MAQPIFDTLGFVKRLSAAGMNAGQAEALAEALTVHAFQELATKTDLRELELRLTSEMNALETRISLRLGSAIAAATALTVAVLGTLIALL